jgi:polyamine oxidase
MSPDSKKLIFFVLLVAQFAIAPPLLSRKRTCRKTSIAVLGAGMAGITAAQTLSNTSVTDFIIIDVNSYIGGRVAHAQFGKDPGGNPYTVELGANWVQGLGSPHGPENPVWFLARKYNLTTTYSNLTSILTYDQHGPNDYTDLLNEYDNAYSLVEGDAGLMLSHGYQDRSFRAGLSLAGWKPKKNMLQQASEWWRFDWEYSHSPDLTSQTFAVVVSLSTFNIDHMELSIIAI